MKKSRKVWIIIAAILIVAGTALSFAVLAVNDFDIKVLDTEKNVNFENEFTDAVNTVVINVSSVDVCVKKSEDGVVKVKYEGSESTKVGSSIDDGTLTVTGEICRRKWYDHIQFSLLPEKVTVYIPDGLAVTVSSKSGDVSIKGLSVTDAAVNVQSGDISLESFNADSFTVNSSSGDIDVDGCRFASDSAISLKSGNIAVNGGEFSGKLNIKTLSGDVSVKKTALFGGADITASSGNVKITATNALKFDVSTSSGGKKVKKSLDGSPVCKIKTKSGDAFADFVG